MPTDGLSGLLRARTLPAHAEVERSPSMTALAEGRVTTEGLVALLSRLLPVYEALEAAAARCSGDPRVGRFMRPELDRAARLRADLLHLTGSADVVATPASCAYAGRIAQVGAAGFVAHHYTRCLGDLSGGQVVRASLERRLGLTDGAGASFFAFPGVRLAELRQEYRGWLDAAPFTEAEREELVEEALVAYRLNADIAAELDADLGRWTS